MTACREFMGPRDRDGYATPYLGPDGERRRVRLHRWVVEQVEGRPLAADEFVLHSCDNPPCFLYEHLRVGTAAVNTADMMRRGRANPPAGARSGITTLTPTDVRAIRQAAAGGESQRSIARRYDVWQTTVSDIVRRISWTEV